MQAHPSPRRVLHDRVENRYRSFPAMLFHWDAVAESMSELDGTCRIVSMASDRLSPAEAW